MLVVSIPASDIEVGGDAGKEALTRLSNVIFRQEASWKPASPEEGFEIVRRRLFDEVPAELARERDAVVNAFADLYQRQSAEFPLGVRGGRLPAADEVRLPDPPRAVRQAVRGLVDAGEVPAHPRRPAPDGRRHPRAVGARRLVADDHARVGADRRRVAVQAELVRYLEDGWTPVIAADVDGENALPLQLDRENPNLGRYSATRRVARTIYLGSAPTLHQTNKGIDDRTIKLGCVQPGESPAVFGDALRRLANRATYLVEDNGQYWYALGQTISRTAADRAQSRFLEEHADDEIRRRLLATKERGRVRRCALGAARRRRRCRTRWRRGSSCSGRTRRTAQGTQASPALEMAASDPSGALRRAAAEP